MQTTTINYADYKATDYKAKIYYFISEIGDRRTALYKKLITIQTDIETNFGKDSKEINSFWDADLSKMLDLKLI